MSARAKKGAGIFKQVSEATRSWPRTFNFGDIAGKLHTLQIECTRCARKRRYNVAKLIAQYGVRCQECDATSSQNCGV